MFLPSTENLVIDFNFFQAEEELSETDWNCLRTSLNQREEERQENGLLGDFCPFASLHLPAGLCRAVAVRQAR